MKNKILDKLNGKLISVPTAESDVVYILSRIRKILEIDNKKDKYIYLNFYCNWALHSILEKPPKIICENLQKIKNGYLNPVESAKLSIEFAYFKDFHREMRGFLKEYNLSENIYIEKNNKKDFEKFLCDIYLETPIILTIEEKFEVKMRMERGGVRGIFCGPKK